MFFSSQSENNMEANMHGLKWANDNKIKFLQKKNGNLMILGIIYIMSRHEHIIVYVHMCMYTVCIFAGITHTSMLTTHI